MRPRLDPKAPVKMRGVSLPPALNSKASKRAYALGMSFSQYLRVLIQKDLRDELIKL